MRKFAKPILIAVASVAALGAVLVLAVNLYLQSKEVQQKIRKAASNAAGVPIEIRGTHYLPWRGLVVSGVVIPPDSSAIAPFLEMESVSLHFRLIPIFQGRFITKEVRVKNPTLAVFQKPDNSWSRPARLVSEKPVKPAIIPIPQATASPAEAAPTAVPVPVLTPVPGEVSLAAAPAPLELLTIRGGQATFDDKSGRRLASFRGVSVTLRPQAGGVIQGEFEAEEVELMGLLMPRHVRGTFSWRYDHLEIPEFSAEWAGGTLRGRVSVVSGSEPRFSAKAAAENVQLQKLADDAGLTSSTTRGAFFLEGELTGVTGEPATFVGGGHAELRSAKFQPADFIRQIGELLSIEELQVLQLKTATADFSVENEKVITKNLVLESENLIVEAEGPTTFSGKLDLDARLHFNDRLRRDLKALLGNSLKPSERKGYSHVPFSVGGTVSKPKTDLLDKLAGARLGRDVGNLLKGFLRVPSEKKPAPQETPAGDPAGGQ